MSLEEGLKDLASLIKKQIEVIEENNALTRELLDGRGAAIEALNKGKKSDVGKTDASEKASEAKDADGGKAETPKKPAPKKPAAKKAPAKKKAPTQDEMLAVFAAYMDPGEDDEWTEDEAVDFVQAILNELGAEKVREIKAEDRQKAMDWVERKKTGEDVDFDDDGEEEEESGSKKSLL